MKFLNSDEKEFLDVFLHEATTWPFMGPATESLHKIGVEYADVPYLAWAYHKGVPRTSFGWGHSADGAPPLRWADRESVLRRNEEIGRIWEREHKTMASSKVAG